MAASTMNPTPFQIRAARAGAGLTQTQAAQLIGGSMRAWQQWEHGKRKMPPGLFELFRIKTLPDRYNALRNPANPTKTYGVIDGLPFNGDDLDYAIDHSKEKIMTHTYQPMLRPASFCTLPAGIKWIFVMAPWDLITNTGLPRAPTRHGVIATDRRLTDEECESFDLRPV